MTRVESRLGVSVGVGTTYVNVGTVAAATTWNLILEAVNKTAGIVKLRAYAADATWASTEPTGSTLQYTICYDLPIEVGETVQISGIILLTGEKLVVRCDTATGVDVAAMGVKIT